MSKTNQIDDSKQTQMTQTESGLTKEQIDAIVSDRFRQFFGDVGAREAGNLEETDDLQDRINDKLTSKQSLSVAFPECSDVLLSLINPTEAKKKAEAENKKIDEITAFFNDYFSFARHSVIAVNLDDTLVDPKLKECTGGQANSFPPPWCLPPTCVTLNGSRRSFAFEDENGNKNLKLLKRLFVADLVWLFYFDRMGIFKILGAILDDYAIKGKLPISNGSVNAPGVENKDDLVTIVLEAMTRKTKMGLSSTVRDRNISYRRGLGWILDEGRKLNLDTVINTAFTNQFHKFIQIALEYYKDKRLATAIQASTNVNRVSVATLTSIKDTIDLLRRTFDAFSYGRNYSNTLSGIVWAIAGMALIREMRTTLGIPSEYAEPDKFIQAAYDILIAKTSITPSETNRYDVHRDCAANARDILLDLEVIDIENAKQNSDLEVWLTLVEDKIESYRTAYRSLTGIDLGTSGTPLIEQQV